MWALGQVMVKQLVEPPSGLTLTAWIGVFSGPQMIFGSMLLATGATRIPVRSQLDRLGGDSLSGIDHDGNGVRHLVPGSFAKSCFAGDSRSAATSGLHHRLQRSFSG